jgi:geranylgeranyl reductase family protein
MTFDAIIVGAGPAGSYLAYLLAQAGRSVAIIDKATFPRDKVCGGGVSRKALELLDFDIAPVVQKTIIGAYLAYRNEALTIKDITPPVGCTVLRSEFDNLLLQKAQAAGAQFSAATQFVDVAHDASAVLLHTSNGPLRGRFLLAADGVGSAVRSKVFGKQLVHYVPALEALVHLDDERMGIFAERALFDFAGMTRGYGWIFPKRDHLNVGVYSPFGGNRLRAELDRFMAHYSLLASAKAIDYRGYAIPVRNRRSEFERDRVWLIGDAAGFAESVFGEGIYFALRSAGLAAQALLRADGKPNTYSTLVRRALLPELRASRLIGSLLFRFPRFAFHHLVANPRVNRYFAGLISGDVGYRECVLRTAASLPHWLFHRAALQPGLAACQTAEHPARPSQSTTPMRRGRAG